MAGDMQARFSRRAFLKGLGALALTALPACRRAQQYAVQLEDSPEFLSSGEEVCYASAMPWAAGAFPLLAVCRDGVPISLQPNPAYTAQAGLPAFVQASLLDLYSPRRPTQPTFGGKPLPWQGLQGSFRAWARALQAGRKAAFLFPAGFSPVRLAQMRALNALPAVSFYAWDPVATPRPPLFDALEAAQRAALGPSVAFDASCGSLSELVARLPELDLLFIFTPADPAGLDPAFDRALEQCHAETIRFSLRPADATARRCLYHVPLTHFLEEWGAEADAYGNLCLRQPVTCPLVPSIAEADALHALLHDGELPPLDPPKPTPTAALSWLTRVCPDAREALRKGFCAGAAPLPRPLPPASSPRPYLHPLFVDGRFLHNLWLREAYDPISGAAGAPAVFLPGKVWAAAAPVQWGPYTLPAHYTPGLAEPCVPMLPGVAMELPPRPAQAAFPARPLRPLPPDSQPAPEPPSGPSPQWGLVIDLAACVGCNACTIACRAENNIPTVGQDEQQRGRDIQWLRIDRYLESDGQKLRLAPAMCRQCHNAPCEAVCPVNATVHTSDGLNAMVYPRCWGTRYCSAACPYHARTFNFHDYARASRAVTALPPNPQVTVRSRGVMEKCTCCVQRIQAAKLRHSAEPPRTACQLACPRRAIRLVNWATEPIPPHATSRFDTPGTRPAVIYLLPSAS